MTRLSVNLNKFALLRNARGTDCPNLAGMATRAIAAGVDGITVHPRPDERHTRYADVYELAELCRGHENIEFNVEGNPVPRFLAVVRETRPDQCTLVPDAPGQITSDHGYDMVRDAAALKPVVEDLKSHGIRVSCFIDADSAQIEAAPSSGTDRVELYTEPYARAFGTAGLDAVLGQFRDAALCAQQLGLGVNAGHDLNLDNLGTFLSIPGILEVSIGHAIVVESFDYGFEDTLKRYLEIIRNS